MSTTKEAFEFQWGEGETPNVEAAVGQALGAASMCWSETPTGVFESEQAREIGDKLTRFVLDTLTNQARLGCATTTELIRELAARAEVSEIAGESWPKYRPVDDH